jgi:hypothetical protein
MKAVLTLAASSIAVSEAPIVAPRAGDRARAGAVIGDARLGGVPQFPLRNFCAGKVSAGHRFEARAARSTDVADQLSGLDIWTFPDV